MVLIDLQRGGRGRGPCSRLETPINFYVFRFVKKVSGRAFLFFFLHTPGSVREGMARNPIQVGMAQGGGQTAYRSSQRSWSPEFAAQEGPAAIVRRGVPTAKRYAQSNGCLRSCVGEKFKLR